MKQILMVILFVLSSAYAQDTLIFKNGNIVPVKIIAFQNSDGLVVYVVNQDTIYAAQLAVAEYKIHSKLETSYIPQSTTIVDENFGYEPKKYKKLFFKKPLSFEYARFSVSTNLLAPIPTFFRFATNPLISLEPEILIHDKFSIRIPFEFGFGRSKGDEIFTSTYGYYYGVYTESIYINFAQPNDHSIDPYISYIQVPRAKDSYDHPKELVFQAGIVPKFYPFGQTANAFYIAQSFNFGISSSNKNEYYFDYDTTGYFDTYSNEWIESWILTNYKVQGVGKTSTVYFRYESLIGINFNFSKSICLSLESGVTTTLPATNINSDKFYIKTPFHDYQPITPTNVYNYSKGKINGVMRVHLVYKFGGKRLKPKKK